MIVYYTYLPRSGLNHIESKHQEFIPNYLNKQMKKECIWNSEIIIIYVVLLGYRRPRLVYKVWYRAIDVSEWRTMRVSSSFETEANITNLLPAQEYEIMIMSEDANGDGMFSKAIKVYTKRKFANTSLYEKICILVLCQELARRHYRMRWYLD